MTETKAPFVRCFLLKSLLKFLLWCWYFFSLREKVRICGFDREIEPGFFIFFLYDDRHDIPFFYVCFDVLDAGCRRLRVNIVSFSFKLLMGCE